VAAGIWLGSALGLHLGPGALLGVAATLGVAALGGARRRPLVALGAVVLLVGLLAGALGARRQEAAQQVPLPTGSLRVLLRIETDPFGRDGTRALARVTARRERGRWLSWDGPVVLLGFDTSPALQVGDVVVATGEMSAHPGRLRGRPVAGRLRVRRWRRAGTAAGPFLTLGNLVRGRVAEVLATAEDPSQALLSGFLVGDVSDLPPHDVEALRRSGLTHLVAVSGSNVALFLTMWWVVTFPLATRPRPRAVLGILGLAVFAAATRWEPSVLRASVMAGLVLVGPVLGVALDAWTALGGAVALLLVASPELGGSVGFQLSVAATAGILLGAGGFAGHRPRLLWSALGAAVAAQVAVVPVLLWHFGTVPLLSPVANLLAAPLVTVATATATVAVATGVPLLVSLARLPAAGVLLVARTAADWPQLSRSGVAAVAAGALLSRHRRLRPLVAVVVAVVLVGGLVARPGPPDRPTAIFLDVGQGDAVLLRDPGGATVLVDGGRDPVRLVGALRRYGVRRIDLLVATHGDLDHVGGLAGILAAVPVGRLWYPDHPDLGPVLGELVEEAGLRGVLAERPRPGRTVTLGGFHIEVLGPRRRYRKQNDGSVVLLVAAGERTLLLAGDVEAVAQRELPPLHPDVLLVPHHGSRTSDLGWLARTAGDVAVVSVGPNEYGHPAPEVLAVLAAAGATIHVTWNEGDVAIPFLRDPAPVPAGRAVDP